MNPKHKPILGRFIRDLEELPAVEYSEQREIILDVLGDLGAASPKELLEADPRIRRSTLYQNLPLLEKANRIELTSSGDRYKRTGVFVPL